MFDADCYDVVCDHEIMSPSGWTYSQYCGDRRYCLGVGQLGRFLGPESPDIKAGSASVHQHTEMNNEHEVLCERKNGVPHPMLPSSLTMISMMGEEHGCTQGDWRLADSSKRPGPAVFAAFIDCREEFREGSMDRDE